MSDFNLALQIDKLKKQEKAELKTDKDPEQLVSFRGGSDSPNKDVAPSQEVKIEMPQDGKLLPPKLDDGKERLNPNMFESSLPAFKKTQQYYDDLDLNMDDLENVENRISELERYIGIENQELEFFTSHDIEKLDVKCHRVDDFVKVIEDKNFVMNDLFAKYD